MQPLIATFAELKDHWRVEVLEAPGKPIRIKRLLRRVAAKESPSFLFWYRLAQFLYCRPRGLLNYRKLAERINRRLIRQHNIEILLGARIAPGLRLPHRMGICVSNLAVIGRNVMIRQHTTIGIKSDDPARLVGIFIGDNVSLGAHVCIVGDHLTIGDNVVVGAGALVMRNISANSLYYSRHEAVIRPLPGATPVDDGL